MDKPHDEKENFLTSNPFPNYLLSAPNLQLFSLNTNKKTKTKTKSQKGHSSNLRAGDWVCLICNNLNFSFRNECNRCQVQTKEQNQLQSLYITETSTTQDLLQNRLPFKDLTNGKTQSITNKVINNNISTSHTKSKSTPIHGDIGPNVLQNLFNNEEIQGKIPAHLLQGKQSNNKGFENKLLVTPPKHRQNKSLNIFKEYSDSSSKELPPYRSPEHLPSISPIMKNVFGINYKELNTREMRNRSMFTFLGDDGQTISEIEEHESKESSFIEDPHRVGQIRDKLASMEHSRVNSGSGTVGSENGWKSTVENSLEGDYFDTIKEMRPDKKDERIGQ